MITNKSLMRLILAAIMCIVTYTAHAEDNPDNVIYYKVALDGNNALNIRQEPYEKAAVIGKVPGNNVLNVINQTEDGEWFEVKYNNLHGYAKSEYIKRCERKPAFGDNVSRIFKMTNSLVPPWSNPLKTWMTKGLLIIAIIIGFIHKGLSEDSKTHIVLTSILSIIVILYVVYMGSNALWFFNVSKSGGWMWFFIHVLLFLFFVSIQVGSFLYTKLSLPVNLNFGITCVILFFVGLIVCTFIGSKYVPWLFGAFILSQVTQCVMIGRKGYTWYAIAYFIIMAATVMLLLPTLIIGIIATVCMLMIAFISNDDCTDKNVPEYQEEPKFDIEIKGGGIFGEDIKAKTDVFGAVDENGRRWTKNNDGTYSKD